MVVDTINCTLKFDPSMTLKEDYDFTAAHLHTHGAVMRVNRLLMKALHCCHPLLRPPDAHPAPISVLS